MQNSRKKLHLAVMFGGKSAEHEISVISGLQAIMATDPLRYHIMPVYIALSGKWYTGENLLDKNFYKKLPESLSLVEEITLLPDPSIGGFFSVKTKKTFPVDACLLAFHGQSVEDGAVQGLLELADLPYTGCNVTASAVAMNKYLCKTFFAGHGIPTLPSITISREWVAKDPNKALETIQNTSGLEKFPLFVKPNHLGSSIGVSVAKNPEDLLASLAKTLRYDDVALIEPCLTDKIEINVAVIEGNPPFASVTEIPISEKNEALTYEDKYMRGGKKCGGQSLGMAGLTRVVDPPHLEVSIKKQATEYALKGFSLLRCSGVVRFDFMLDAGTNTLFFNELNPIPGSLSYYLWEKSNPPLHYTDLINRLVDSAIERKADQLALHKNLGFKAL